MTNCSNDFPTTDVLFNEISGDTLYIVFLAAGCVLALTTVLMCLETVFYMKRVGYTRYKPHYRQRCLLVGLYPVVCVMSVISLLVPTSTILIDLIIACYISWCIFTFVEMTVNYYGGEMQMIQTLFEEKVKLNTPPCCCCCCCLLKPVTLSRKSLRVLKVFTIQVAYLRPLVVFVAAVLWTNGNYEQTFEVNSGYPYIAVISGISTLLSMYGMIVIFRASIQHLRENGYVVKFVALQVTVVIANLQSIVFNLLAQRGKPGCIRSRGPVVRDAGISHGLLVVECFLLCLLARYGYRREEPHLEKLAQHGRGEPDGAPELYTKLEVENHVAYGANSKTQTKGIV